MTIYDPNTCAAFYRIKDKFGDYSNFAHGYPITVNDVVYKTSEALYQCGRFPNHPDIQQMIIDAANPKIVKEIAKEHQSLTRPDWINEDKSGGFRMSMMSWVLYAKLFCNYQKFSKALLESDNLIIVETSKQDDFWGAKPKSDGTLVGANHLGIMLTELRNVLPDLETKRLNSEVVEIDMVNSPKIAFRFLGEIAKPIRLAF